MSQGPRLSQQYTGRPSHPLDVARVRAGLRVCDLVERSGVRRHTIEAIANGRRPYYGDERARLARACGCQPESI